MALRCHLDSGAVRLLRLVPLVALWACSCSRTDSGASDDYLTWSSLDRTYEERELPPAEGAMSQGEIPVAGIVSHHLLAGSLLDAWFRCLAEHREVSTFIVLSPRHWDVGTQTISVTTWAWSTAQGPVQADAWAARRVLRSLGLHPDPGAFLEEHGVSTLIPFIRKYFPAACVLPIAYDGEPPVDLPLAQDLFRALEPLLLRPGYFLLVSADFSHHSGPAETAAKDDRTRHFLDDPGPRTWIYAACDNRPAMYALGQLSATMAAPRFSVLYHTDSYLLSRDGVDDITSYFFAYLVNGAEE